MDFHIRTLQPADVPAAQALAHDAGLGGAAPFIPHYVAWQPDGYVLAVDAAGTPVACVGAQRFGSVAFIGSMCVASSQQRKGLGGMVLSHLLERLATQGCTGQALEATPEGAGLYRKLGFTTQHRTQVWRQAGTRLVGPHGGAQPLLDQASREQVLELDAACVGFPRHRALQGWLDLHAGRAVVARNSSGRVCGYVTAGDGRVGPWVAPDAGDAAWLLDQALALPFATPPMLYVPEPDVAAATLLQARGFGVVRTLERMVRGNVPEGLPHSVHALATAGMG